MSETDMKGSSDVNGAHALRTIMEEVGLTSDDESSPVSGSLRLSSLLLHLQERLFVHEQIGPLRHLEQHRWMMATPIKILHEFSRSSVLGYRHADRE